VGNSLSDLQAHFRRRTHQLHAAFGHRIQDSDIRAIAAGGDIASTLTRASFPELQDAGALLDEPQSGLPRLEIELKRSVVRRCLAAFLGNPFHIGIPLAYLVLHDLEVQDLIVLLEAKVSQVVSEEFHLYLVSGAGVAA
jgi:vacuolar-type H+-ATPase subunit C/Vma6